LYLLAGTVLGSAAVLGIHYLQTGRIAEALLWQARRAEDQGRLDQVARFLHRYLEFVPENNDERARLGQVLANEKLAVTTRARQKAYFVLNQVLIREPNRHDLRPLVTRVAMDLRRYDAAEEHLQALQKAVQETGETAQLYGRLYEARGQYAEAAEAWRKAIQHAPEQIDHYVRRARILRYRLDPAKQAENTAEADRVMDELVAKNPQQPQAYLARWRYRKETGVLLAPEKREEATHDVNRALQLAPEDAEVILAAVEVAQVTEQLDQARTHLRQGLKLHPADGRMYQALAMLEIQADQRRAAVTALRRGLKAVPRQARNDLLWTLANILIDGNERGEAEAVLELMRKGNAPPASFDYLLARLLMHQGQWLEASRRLERVRPLLESSPELGKQTDLYLGHCYEQLEEPSQQLAAYERVLTRDPQSVPARLGMANAFLALGRLTDTLDQYRQVMALPQAPEWGWAEIARLLILRNLQREQRDWQEVTEALKRANTAQPQSVTTLLLTAEALLAQDQPDKAEQLLRAAQDQQPTEVKLWIALAALDERQKEFDQAWRLLEEAGEKIGDSIELRLARAQHWVQRRTDESAARLHPLAENIEKFSANEQAQLLRGLAEAHYRIDNLKEAEQLWRSLAAKPPHNHDLRIQLYLFDLAFRGGDEAGMQRALADIRRIESGQGPYWRFCEASRLLWLARQGKPSNLEEARAHLEAVETRRPGWPAVPLAKAELEDLKGNPEQAIAGYRRALQLGERSPRVVRQLVHLLYQRHRYEEADQEIRRLQKQAPMSGNLQRLAAEISLRNQDPVRASELAMQAVAADSKDYRDYLWLGQLLSAGGKHPQEAETHLRQAVELAATAPETWVALVQHLAGTNQHDQAEAAIQQARAKIPADQTPLALGQCFEAVRRIDDARREYQAARAARPGDVLVLRSVASFYLRVGPAREAEPVLRTLVERKVEASTEDVAWARRNLAMLLATHRETSKFQEALKLVGLEMDARGNIKSQSDPANQDTVEDQRARARVLATRQRRALRTQAIALLEKLNQRQPLVPDDQFLLARSYEENGDWPKARETLTSLVLAQDKTPQYRSHYAQGLIRHGEVDEALRHIERLETLEQSQQAGPGAYGSVTLRALALEARGEVDRGLSLLKAYVEKQGTQPGDCLNLIGYLARQKRTQEALD
jgi:tetratricopeptide (TPR) repeat protein